ncbi:MAG: hypothetical protein BI182_12830 [Acetobacterium sp. MES1]|uniref:hypothetical protein n=1 Tax=Acetobacterium sp. MES1 TaxID=1899015 RepID=UPI000B9C90DF|nr:hypothetical protein [Acetobacterium sp. MES1]OXS25778.1 MAG: hypothetical protein BI182_12830 [Acetobacterium sp. MES1]
MKKKIVLVGAVALLLVVLSGCQQADVVGKQSIASFDAVLQAIPDQIAEDEMNGGWALSAPDGTARFIWSKDYSSGAPHDVMLEVDAKPFLAAGLDVTKLPAGMLVDDKIMVGTMLGDEKLTYSGEVTPLASYEQLVNLKRDHIKYHTALDHYGVDIGDGNMFEWAKDLSTNDKDIVFVLNPQIFIDAGVDPDKVEGWVFAKVSAEDEDKKPIEVDKFLKPFNIK